METMPLILKEVLSESLVHTATMLPVLFLAFIIVEFASHRTGAGWLRRGMAHPYLGPVAAAGLGLLPQCGFSVATTSLFLEGMIPTGSLLASYIATSDEAVPILLSNPATLPWVLPLLATKLVWEPCRYRGELGLETFGHELTGASRTVCEGRRRKRAHPRPREDLRWNPGNVERVRPPCLFQGGENSGDGVRPIVALQRGGPPVRPSPGLGSRRGWDCKAPCRVVPGPYPFVRHVGGVSGRFQFRPCIIRRFGERAHSQCRRRASRSREGIKKQVANAGCDCPARTLSFHLRHACRTAYAGVGARNVSILYPQEDLQTTPDRGFHFRETRKPGDTRRRRRHSRRQTPGEAALHYKKGRPRREKTVVDGRRDLGQAR